MSTLLFDEPYYLEINEARWALAARTIAQLGRQVPGGVRTCADVGAGPGWFSERLVGQGLEVVGLEGRAELTAEAARRVTGATFKQVNVESSSEMGELGRFDLVFCFGLLYHTENPFAVVRNLERLTGEVLFIETMVLPTDEPIFRLVGEGQNETQGLTYHSLIASRSALVKMLQTAGFSWVGEYMGRVDHPDFVDSPSRYRRRGVYLASRRPLTVDNFRLCPPVDAPKYTFVKPGRDNTR